MVRVGISVEGATEERFVKMVLAPYLATKQIYVTPISVGGAINLDSPEAIAMRLSGDNLMSWAQALLSRFNNNPEDINDSTETAPSKRLIQKTNYRKTTHGPNIAEEIGIEVLREKCGGFDEWLVRLESLTQ